MKTLVNFLVRVMGDGVSTTSAIALATAPINADAPVSMASVVPTGVISLSSSDGQAVTAAILAGVCTLTWPLAVPNGKVVEVYGQFVF